MSSKTIQQICWCGTTFPARQADINRGWGKACCKAHAAHAREKRKGANGFRRRKEHLATGNDIDYEGQGWGAHHDGVYRM